MTNFLQSRFKCLSIDRLIDRFNNICYIKKKKTSLSLDTIVRSFINILLNLNLNYKEDSVLLLLIGGCLLLLLVVFFFFTKFNYCLVLFVGEVLFI